MCKKYDVSATEKVSLEYDNLSHSEEGEGGFKNFCVTQLMDDPFSIQAESFM